MSVRSQVCALIAAVLLLTVSLTGRGIPVWLGILWLVVTLVLVLVPVRRARR